MRLEEFLFVCREQLDALAANVVKLRTSSRQALSY
jgi:hypothetical protein